MDLSSFTEVANSLAESSPTLFYVLIILLLVWKLIWYGQALYSTIEKKQKIWFIVLFIATFILNDLGILAIIYLIIEKNKTKKKAKKK